MYSVHRQPLDSLHKGTVIRKMFPCFGFFMPLGTNSWNAHQSMINCSFKNEFQYHLQNGGHVVSASICRNYELKETVLKQNKKPIHVSWDILDKVNIAVFTTKITYKLTCCVSLLCTIMYQYTTCHAYLRSHHPWLDACHCSDVILGAMSSQNTSLTIVYSTVYSGPDQRKHQSPVSLAF